MRRILDPKFTIFYFIHLLLHSTSRLNRTGNQELIETGNQVVKTTKPLIIPQQIKLRKENVKPVQS